jgi:uncharacterized protein YndB with AHSA1/START domain
MPEVIQTIDIHASPERVWDMVTALRYLPLWLEGIASVSAISTPESAAGATFELTRKGSSARGSWIVAEWNPGQFVRLTEYRHDLHYIFELAPIAGGAQLTLTYRWPQRGLAKLLPPTAQRRLVQRSLTKLKELMDFNRDIALLHGIGDE